MADEGKLGDAVLHLSTDSNDLRAGLNQAKTDVTALAEHFKSASGMITNMLGAAGIGLGMHAFLEATIHAERESALLEAAVKNTGQAAGFTANQLRAQASALQAMSGQSDESIMSAQRAMMSFRNVQNDVFKDGIKLALDLAAKTGGDAADAARTLGMALNDPVEGMDRLRRAGIQVTAATRAQIQALSDHGDILGEQKLLLEEMKKGLEGTAEAARGTLGGALANLKNVIEDNVLEINGPFLQGMKQAVEILATWVPNAVRLAGSAFVLLREVIGGLMEAVYYFAQSVYEFFHGNLIGAAKLAKEAFVSVGEGIAQGAFQALQTWDKMGEEQKKLAANTKALADQAGNASGKLEDMGRRGQEAMKAASEAAKQAALAVAQAAKGPILDAAEDFNSLMVKARAAATAAKTAATQAASAARAGMASNAEAFKRTAEAAAKNAEEFSKKAVASALKWKQSMLAFAESTAGTIGGFVSQMAQGQMSVEQFAQKAIQQIAMLIAKLLALAAIKMMFGGPLGMPGVSKILNSFVEGAFAEGGEVGGGRPILVGENGPELFVPPSSGTIVPNDRMGGGGGGPVVNQYFNIAGLDLSSAEAARKFLTTAAAQMRSGAIEALAFAKAATDQSSLQGNRAFA